jgi:hypothetical protein
MRADIVLPRHRNPPTGKSGRTIGNAGCAILTATLLCSRVQPVRRNSSERATRWRRASVT